MKVSSSSRPRRHVEQACSPEGSTGTDSGGVPATAGIGSSGVFADDPGGFRALYDRWFEDVERWIRALGGLEADRDDIVQEVFLVVRRRLGAFDGTNPAGWLYRITRRQVRDFRRRTWVKHIFTRRRSDEPDILPHGDGGPAAALELKERRRMLHVLLQKMNEDRRSAFVLFEVEGLSGDEIARIQNVPLNTVWTRLHHARKEFFALAAKHQKAYERELTRGKASP